MLVVGAVALADAVRGGDGLVAALRMWDGNWYVSAAVGYSLSPVAAAGPPQSNVAFLPLLPLSIRGLSWLTGLEPAVAGIVVVHLYGALFTVLLWLLVRHLADVAVAERSVILCCFFPGAAVLSMVYAEAAMLAMAAGCLLALLQRRWVTAGGAAALAAAARPTGLVLGASCLWAAIAALRRGDWKAVAAPVLAPVGLLAYFAYLWRLSGEPDVWFRVQSEGWGAGLDFGAQVAELVVATARNPAGVNTTVALQLLGLATIVVGGVLLWRWRPPAVVVVYTLGMVAAMVLTTTETAGGTRPRLVLTAFPLLVAIARQLRGPVFAVLAAGSAVAMAATAVVYSIPWWVIP